MSRRAGRRRRYFNEVAIETRNMPHGARRTVNSRPIELETAKDILAEVLHAGPAKRKR